MARSPHLSPHCTSCIKHCSFTTTHESLEDWLYCAQAGRPKSGSGQMKTDPQIQRTNQWLPGERKEERGKVGAGEEEEQTIMYKVDKLQDIVSSITSPKASKQLLILPGGGREGPSG